MSNWRCIQTVSLCVLLLTGTAHAQSSDAGDQAAPPAADQSSPPAPNQAVPGGQSANLVTCSSQLGQRIQCAVDTSVGVALVRSRGAAPCLYGDTWGFDAAGIWVSDGCGGVFLVGGVAQVQVTEVTQSAPDVRAERGVLAVQR